MGAPDTSSPPSSALQRLIHDKQIPPGSSASLTHLALQIAHNLRYQHGWTDLRIHTSSTVTSEAMARPVISGLPPERLYVHPDEQIELLQRQKAEGKSGMPKLDSEREWVLPSQLRETWSLRRFGEVFDQIEILPTPNQGAAAFDIEYQPNPTGQEITRNENREPNPWRTTKRILLATQDDDSTVVYYIVHDGIVKPRQN